MMVKKWTRRGFLAAAAAALGYSGLRWGVFGRDVNVRLSFRKLLEHVAASVSLDPDVGNAYLDDPQTSLKDAAALSGALQDRLGEPARRLAWLNTGLAIDDAELRTLLGEAIREDFKQDRICHLQGWYLSETECRLAAVRYLVLEASGTLPVVDETFRDRELCRIVDWGPRFTRRGQPFNRQTTGESALWIKADGAPPGVVVVVGKVELDTTVSPDLIGADLPTEKEGQVLDEPASHEVYLVSYARRVKQHVGTFRVLLPKAEEQGVDLASCQEKDFQQVRAWGPPNTHAGRPFNRQSSGQSALWIATPAGEWSPVQVWLGDEPLETVWSSTRISGSLTKAQENLLLASPAKLPLWLVEPYRHLKQRIGDFEVLAADGSTP